ncbi:MAG: LysR family transcriptional regulator [Pseudomonadota bacterium]
MNIYGLDLNLMKVFQALYDERNVTRAAERVGLAQPSLSNALARLRARFDDDLFIRTPGAMEPTSRARAMAGPITEALRLIEGAVSDPAPFDPASATGEVAISWPDNMMAGVGQALIREVRRDAPGLLLHFRVLKKDTLWADMDADEVHLAVGVFKEVPRRFHCAPLDEDEFVCLVPRTHPAAENLTLAAYLAADHVVTSFRAASRLSVIDKALAARGLSRRVVMTVSQFSPLPDMLEAGGAIATLPRSAARSLSGRGDLVVRALPLEVPSWTNSHILSARAAGRPEVLYIRDVMVRTCLG